MESNGYRREDAYAHIRKKSGVCGGAPCIDDTRIRVIDIVQAHRQGHTVEQIQELFAIKLTLAQVYSALAYADENRAEVDAEFEEHERVATEGELKRAEHLKNRPGQ